MTNSISEIRDTDLMFVIGSNTSEAHPIIAMEMKRAVRAARRLIVADPRAIWMAGIADKHLQLRPGTDVWLLNAMAHVIVTEGWSTRPSSTRAHRGLRGGARGRAGLPARGGPRRSRAFPPRTSARRRELYATTRKAGIYYTLGITEHTHGTDNVYAWPTWC